MSERVDGEAYFTPPWCVHRLLDELPGGLTGSWLEPACGSGAIVRAVLAHPAGAMSSWSASDIKPADSDAAPGVHPDTLSIQDIGLGRRGASWPERFNGMMTNPPFSMAADFLRVGLEVADVVILLLRMNRLASASRADILEGNMPDVYILPNRPSFVNGNTDSTEYAWMVWRSSWSRKSGSISRLSVTAPGERRRK